jgi:hypothetical protein
MTGQLMILIYVKCRRKYMHNTRQVNICRPPYR